MSPRLAEKLRTLAERGATEGEREAARKGLARVELAMSRRPIVCTWMKLGPIWVITGPEHVLKTGLVMVHARGRLPEQIRVTNVNNIGGLWIAEKVPDLRARPKREPRREPRPKPERKAREPERKVRNEPTPPHSPRRPELMPHQFMPCSELEDMLEQLAGTHVLKATLSAMRKMNVKGWKAEREYLIAAIWREQEPG